MTTYFHVAPATYQPGDDLKCFDLLEAEGYEPEWKWDGNHLDTDVVCLFDTQAEAEAFIGEWLADGVLLQVEIPADADNVRFTRVGEGFKAIFQRIPAEYIQVVK